jgi:arabinofuranosyltransferase
VHFIDKYGLVDALIARLPAEVPWRVGHYVRRPPDGYLETLETGHNRIRDPSIAAYYERIRLITEGRLWSRERFRTILRMNLGQYDHLIESYGLVRVAFGDVSTVRTDGTPWDLPGNVVMTLRGLEVALPAPIRSRGIELSVSRNDRYTIFLMRRGERVDARRVARRMSSDSSLLTVSVQVPADVEFDAIRIEPSAGDGRYSLGHLRVLSEGHPSAQFR